MNFDPLGCISGVVTRHGVWSGGEMSPSRRLPRSAAGAGQTFGTEL